MFLKLGPKGFACATLVTESVMINDSATIAMQAVRILFPSFVGRTTNIVFGNFSSQRNTCIAREIDSQLTVLVDP